MDAEMWAEMGGETQGESVLGNWLKDRPCLTSNIYPALASVLPSELNVTWPYSFYFLVVDSYFGKELSALK